jgi:3-hydroxyacyl-CoA dehydrogenase
MSVGFEVIRNVAVLSLKNPPVNGFSKSLRAGLLSMIDRAHGDPNVEAVVVIGDGGQFSAGADIKEFQVSGREKCSGGGVGV